MDQLHLMTVYVAVAEEQGFAAASRRLNMSPPAVTRAIASLEETLGVQLLSRTTRYVRTTDAGQRYLEDARRIVHDVQMANEAALGINATPRGHLSVTAPVLFGQKYVVPGITQYLQTYPDTQVNAVFLDRVVNLLEEGFDVGIRIGQLPDSNMHAKKVGQVRLMLVASAEYLQQHGSAHSAIHNPTDLNKHTLIASNAGNLAQDWHFMHSGKKISVPIQARLTVTSNQAAINACLQHLGITRVISYQIADELNSGQLIPLLEEYEPAPLPVHIIHREGRIASNKVRSFIDLMAHNLTQNNNLQA
jgi:DNA-binding transcriptional LysR family regulator